MNLPVSFKGEAGSRQISEDIRKNIRKKVKFRAGAGDKQLEPKHEQS